ncbi:hypothetical protein EF918_21730 [Streptomyces sp. WAC06614]|nr:hypothetical protein EF918_21730 [Streptomyces sp. WAC06614]
MLLCPDQEHGGLCGFCGSEEREGIECPWCEQHLVVPDGFALGLPPAGVPGTDTDADTDTDGGGHAPLPAARNDPAVTHACTWCFETFDSPQLLRCPVHADVAVCKGCFTESRLAQAECPYADCGVLLDDEGAMARRATPAGHLVLGRTTPPSDGRVQRGHQCYAAATATACNWAAGTALTTDDAMHLFLMSDKATTTVATGYRAAYEAARRKIGGDPDGARVRKVMERAGGLGALNAAVNALGEPEFPVEVPWLYRPALTDGDLKKAMEAQCTVMVAGSMHWTVVYGCEVDPDGHVTVVYEFDPQTGRHSPAAWDAADARQGCYIVGTDSL